MDKRLILLFPLLFGISLIIYGIYSSSTGYFAYKEDVEAEIQNESVQPESSPISIETVHEEIKETIFNETIELKCPDSCDDNNPCTSEGCSKATNYTCGYIAVAPCCGNSICESDESCSSCSIDCGNCLVGTTQQPIINQTETQNETQPESSTLDHIIINEILTKSPLCGDKEGFEFIELYNPTSSSVSIGNWWVVYYTSTKTDWSNYTWRKELTSDAQIPSRSYYLIAISTYWDNCTEKPDWVISSDYNFGYTAKDGKITASKGAIALHSSFGSVVDAVGWGETNLYEGSPATIEVGKSLQRKSVNADTDNNLNDFIISDIPNPQKST